MIQLTAWPSDASRFTPHMVLTDRQSEGFALMAELVVELASGLSQ
jgi:hypothetical protein